MGTAQRSDLKTATPSYNNFSLQYNRSDGTSWTTINTTYDIFIAALTSDEYKTFDLEIFMATTSSTSDPLAVTLTFKSVAK
ncbi:MAG: hypothetical protein NT038_07345 [Euryarchaeota archaeon]|nr:hypothetical protein [Euryarchaeota archaeon]